MALSESNSAVCTFRTEKTGKAESTPPSSPEGAYNPYAATPAVILWKVEFTTSLV